MNLSFFIAKRYLFSKNNRNAINIISFIAVTVLTVAAAALIIVLSVFNGIDKMVSERINAYAPDLKILPAKGKTFKMTDSKIQNILKLQDVKAYAGVLEENVLIKSGDRQHIAVVKGVDNNFFKTNNIEKLIISGNQSLAADNRHAIFGVGLAVKLGISIPAASSLSVWIPDRKNISTANPQSSFKTMHIIPAAIAEVEEEFDRKYLLTSLKTVQRLTDRPPHTVSALEIDARKKANIDDIQKAMSQILGSKYRVKNRHQQYAFLYSVMQSEKLATFLILSFIILIAGFSITGSVIMLIIEKKANMVSLLNMGIKISAVKKIFIMQGMLITVLSGLIGLSLGAAFCILQQKYGFISYSPDGMYMSTAYPVKLKLSDFVWSFTAIISIGTLISIFPVMKIKRFLAQ